MPTDFWGRQVEDNDKSFEKVQDELYFQHHYHPTNIPTYSPDPKDEGNQNYHASLADTLAKKKSGNDSWTNGIPRKTSSEVYVSGSSSTSSISKGSCIFFLCLGGVVFVGMVILAVLSNLGLL